MDVHFPHLTVEETLKFAIACRTPRLRLSGTRKDFQNNWAETLATVFGLRHTLKTKVGNDFVRGVSGGERKRVSIAEALAARGSVYCWDNATRGLDASTALEYNHAIRAGTNFFGNVAIVAIYQAGENIYKLYDKVTVLYSGLQIYFGPAEQAKEYFEKMGYECPARQSTPEFLTAITDPNGRFAKPGYEDKVPKTAREFESYWKNSSERASLLQEMDEYNSNTSGQGTIDRFRKHFVEQQKQKHQFKGSRYPLNYRKQLSLTMKRGAQRVKGDMAYTITNIAGSIMQSLIIGSLYWNIPQTTSGAFSRGGVIFFALLYNSLTSMAEISHSFDNRPILLKQKGYSLYRSSAEALQGIFSQLPVKVATLVCFSIILYFLANLNRTAGQFFFFLLILIFTAQCLTALFQMIASFCKTPDVANSIAGVGVLILSVYAGYMIPTKSMHPWFRWLNWLDPLAYGYESLMANEFHGREMPCNLLVPSGPGYESVALSNQVCAFTGSVPGDPDVLGDNYITESYGYKWDHAWRNLGIVIGFWIFFLAVNALATEYLRPVAGGGDVLLFKRGSMPEHLVEGENAERVANANEMSKELGKEVEDKEIFSWQHVDYTIPMSGGEHRKLLDDVQGYVKPGTMTALMGESGAGKTTLLNVLSQRVHFGVITGDMLVNGKPIDATFQRRTGYVQQQDLHLAESSVRESLQFAARLRQPANVPDHEKMEYVEKIIHLLGMSDFSEAIVGSIGRGLNVEQRKKLSIGVELVAKPSLLLFLDEPTSGLDSQSAWSIVQFLRSLAAAGQSILCTIHQPSATLFEQFDRLLLLKKGGKTVYFGDIGHNSKTLISYFERNGARRCEPGENPAEYILECIGAGATASIQSDWFDVWTHSEEYRATTEEIKRLQEELSAIPVVHAEKGLEGKFAAPYWVQLRELCRRTYIQYWRSPTYIMAKLFLMIIGGLFIGFTFWKIDNSIQGMQNGMFAVFMIQVLSNPLTIQILNFAYNSRELYEVREAASNTFHWSCLIIAQFLAEIPYHIVFSTLLYCCFYFPVGYDSVAKVAGYFYFVFVILFQLYYVSFGLMVSYVSPDPSSAAIITALLFSFTLAFCGVLQPVSQMPGFWTFMYKVSPYTYFIQAFMADVLHDRPVVCNPEEFSILTPPSGISCSEYLEPFIKMAGGYLENPSSTTSCSYCRYSVADEYLETIGVKYSYRWRNVGFICVYIVFNFCFMLILYYLMRVKHWETPLFVTKLKEFLHRTKGAESPTQDIFKLQEGDRERVCGISPTDETLSGPTDATLSGPTDEALSNEIATDQEEERDGGERKRREDQEEHDEGN